MSKYLTRLREHVSSWTQSNTPPVVPLDKGDGDSRGLYEKLGTYLTRVSETLPLSHVVYANENGCKLKRILPLLTVSQNIFIPITVLIPFLILFTPHLTWHPYGTA
jgi:hypothetical protein